MTMHPAPLPATPSRRRYASPRRHSLPARACVAASIVASLSATPGVRAGELGGREPARVTVKNWSLPTYDVRMRIDDRRYGTLETLESYESRTWIVNPTTCPEARTGEVRIWPPGHTESKQTVVRFRIEWEENPLESNDCRTRILVDESEDFIEVAQVGENVEFTIKVP